MDIAGITIMNVLSKGTSATNVADPMVIRTTKWRWFMLFLFVLYTMANAFPWVHYSILANIVTNYYGVSINAINWTGIIYFVTYIPFIFPAMWLLSKAGLRVILLIGSLGTALGAWIKCGSVAPDRFIVTMVGQTIVAASQVFVLSIPPRLAAVWFGPKEVSTACAIGVLGNQVSLSVELGIALSFLVPRELVKQFFMTGYLAVGFEFAAEITFPESEGTSAGILNQSANVFGIALTELAAYLLTFSDIIANLFLCACLLVGLILTGFIKADLKRKAAQVCRNSSKVDGKAGLRVTVLIGSLGTALGAWIKCGSVAPDRFIVTMVGQTIVAASQVFVLSIPPRLAAVWFGPKEVSTACAIGVLGNQVSLSVEFFMTGYLPIGFEFAAEITFPESEGTSAGILNQSANLFGIALTELAAYLLTFSDIIANLFLCACLLVGLILTVFIKADLKRQAAQVCRNSSKDVGHVNHSLEIT
uniref:Major facilitator superfamily (MFS) profile domain-containing protein n=1 Tax=Strigamia maritima TaxID=126957 RepID=T1IXB3_STRMM